MTIDEIFAKITTHQVEGMMIHSFLQTIMNFLDCLPTLNAIQIGF